MGLDYVEYSMNYFRFFFNVRICFNSIQTACAVKMELTEQLEYFGLETKRSNCFPSYGHIYDGQVMPKKRDQ